MKYDYKICILGSDYVCYTLLKCLEELWNCLPYTDFYAFVFNLEWVTERRHAFLFNLSKLKQA